MTYREPQGLDRYAKFDHSDTRIRQGHFRSKERWYGAWLWCLRHYDYEAAELIYIRNKVSNECDSAGHEDCFYKWCQCSHHSAVQFRAEHPQLRSLAEVESEREERSAA